MFNPLLTALLAELQSSARQKKPIKKCFQHSIHFRLKLTLAVKSFEKITYKSVQYFTIYFVAKIALTSQMKVFSLKFGKEMQSEKLVGENW